MPRGNERRISVGSMPSRMAGSDAKIVMSDEIAVSRRKSRLLTFVGKDILKGMMAFGEAL
jgi:hypothetical protein